MPTLRELDARFLKYVRIDHPTGKVCPEGHDHAGLYEFLDNDGSPWMWSPRPYAEEFHWVETLAEADGLSFDCPLCYKKWKAGKLQGAHGIHVWFEGRSAPPTIGLDSRGKTARWKILEGSTGLDDLKLSPSILVVAPSCGWHGFVGNSGVPAGHAD